MLEHLERIYFALMSLFEGENNTESEQAGN